MQTAFIYSLVDPITEQVKYIGKTINIKKRLKSHLEQAHKEKTLKGYWIGNLLKKGEKPAIEIIDEVPESEWQFWEQHYISLYKSWGFDLKNGDNGGLGFDRYNQETKNKIANSLKGRYYGKTVSYKQYDLNKNFIKKFNSLKEIKNELNLRASDSNISTAFKIHISAYGYFWIKEGFDPEEWFLNFDNKEIENKIKNKEQVGKIAVKYLLGRKASLETKEKQSLAKIGKPTWNSPDKFKFEIK